MCWSVKIQILLFQDEASALWIASQMGHADVAKELLEAGAQLDAVREVRFYF